jgi:hypothetical protein
MRLFPEPAGDLDRIHAGLLPPRALVARAMHRTMMPPTEGDRELIADLAAERTRLQVAQVMRVGWLATADQAWLLGDRGASGCDNAVVRQPRALSLAAGLSRLGPPLAPISS